jgi:cytochrome c oxidase assembly protein subunit 11
MKDADRTRRRNRLMGLGATGVVVGMVGLAFASVPLYRIFCQATGYNGTVQEGGGAAPGATNTTITIRFNANVNPSLPWQFGPDQPSMPLRIGEEGMAFYHAHNTAGIQTTGIATYNVTPEVVGRYFHKTACFCFNEQTLEAGQQAEMPITFWVDPKMLEDPDTSGIRTITVSYTFFRTLEDAAKSGALATAGPHVGPLVR